MSEIEESIVFAFALTNCSNFYTQYFHIRTEVILLRLLIDKYY